ncbi:hypothetical protein [Neobacillus soli]
MAAGNLVDKTVVQGNLIGDAILFSYLGNVLLSILENTGHTS